MIEVMLLKKKILRLQAASTSYNYPIIMLIWWSCYSHTALPRNTRRQAVLKDDDSSNNCKYSKQKLLERWTVTMAIIGLQELKDYNQLDDSLIDLQEYL